LVVLVDLVSKMVVQRRLHRPLNAGGFLSLVPSSNSGLSFSAMSGQTLLNVSLAVLALLFCARLLTRAQSTLATVSLAMIIGGGLSNLLDRALHHGRVTDFLGLSTWFVCNGADIAISLGVVLLLVSFCSGRKVLR
jgi:signal peptidase II